MSKTQQSISEYMAELGRKGGKARGKCKARDPEKMREAGKKGAAARWGSRKES